MEKGLITGTPPVTLLNKCLEIIIEANDGYQTN